MNVPLLQILYIELLPERSAEDVLKVIHELGPLGLGPERVRHRHADVLGPADSHSSRRLILVLG